MARQIAPGNAPEIKAQQFKVDMPDFKLLDDMGDAKIKAANTNFKLYTDVLLKTESAKLYEQYKNDPIQLSNGLEKLGTMVNNLPEELQREFRSKLYLTGVALVQKAENNRVIATDLENKQKAAQSADVSKGLMSESYQIVLKNAMSKAEDKKPIFNDIFLEQVANLNNIVDLKDHNGKDAYSATEKKKIRNIADLELEGFKQFFDGMLLNDNDDLTQSKEYYQQFILAPERFMADNYMDRETYDKARAYAEKELKRAGAKIKDMKQKQSVRQYLELQIEDLPGRVEELRTSGLLPKEMVDSMEKVNVKFNEIDPSKTESPVAMIDLLRIMKDVKSAPAPQTEAEQQKILEQGTAALDAVADYAQTNGLSPEKVKQARETIVNAETNAAFKPILDNFNAIVDNFDSKMNKIRRKSTGKSGWSMLTLLDNMDVREERKLKELNDLLAVATDAINQQIRNGDWEGVRKTQKDVQVGAAQIWYDMIDWKAVAERPDGTLLVNGRPVQFLNYTTDGDILVKTLD